MNLSSLSPAIFYWIVTILFALGVYLLSRQAFEIVADLAAGLVGYLRRRFQPRVMRRLIVFQEQAGVQPDEKEKKSLSLRLILYGLSQLRVAWIALGVLAALIFADALYSPVALTVILVGGELFRAQAFSRRMARLNEDAANLIVQFGSRYPLTRSMTRTLRDAADTLPGGVVRQAVEQCVIRLNMNQNSVEAMKPLRAIAHPVIDRFTSLVADVQDTLPRIVQAAVPAPGLQFASPGGEARSVSVYGVVSGETESRTENGIEFDLARLFYLDDGELRALWFATGYVDGDGTYYPMNMADPRGKQAWGTRQEAEAIFRQSGKGLRLILTGFLRGDKEIAWENCEKWAFANPPGICGLGLDLELALHGGSSQFLQSGLAPDDWFAFGWAIEFNGAADTTLPSNAGGCVP